jgi:hypothetical protein
MDAILFDFLFVIWIWVYLFLFTMICEGCCPCHLLYSMYFMNIILRCDLVGYLSKKHKKSNILLYNYSKIFFMKMM